MPSSARSASVTAPWRLASRAPSAPTTRGTCAHDGRGRPSRSSRWAWLGRGVEQIVAPHDLLDALVVIVHHDGHVVGGHAVVAAQHDVVGGPRDLAVQPVEDRHRRTIGPQAQRRGPALSLAVPAASRAQVAARSGVGPGPHVRRRARLAHLSPGAEARVGEARPPPAGRGPPRGPRGARTAARRARPSRGPAPRGRRAVPPRAIGCSSRDRGPRRAAGSGCRERAKSQARSAVRRFPTWSGPDGLGAKRPTATGRS